MIQSALRVAPLTCWMALMYALNLPFSCAFAQGTQFTYQGQLVTNGVPFSGSAEFQFTLWDAASGGNSIATNNPVSVIPTVDSSGLFTVQLDFGSDAFNGQPRFLQADVRTVIGPFTTLTPRQPLTATPYALRASNLTSNGLAGTYGNAVTMNNAGNSFAGGFAGVFNGAANGDGTGLTNVNAATLGGLTAANFWKTNGNTGANPTNGSFLGTKDNLPLELKVNGVRALRLEPAGGNPNVIGGSALNFAATNVSGATIGGGLGNIIAATSSFVGGGENNKILLDITGSTFAAVVAGGSQNVIGGPAPTGDTSLGGENVVSGGYQNSIRSGGSWNVIAGGAVNTISTNANYASIAGGQLNTIGAISGNSSIGGGYQNSIGDNTFIGTISGGGLNNIGTNSSYAAIGGGAYNNIGALSPNSVISGGNSNNILARSAFATIPGGDSNVATNYAFAAGRHANAVHVGAFVWGDNSTNVIVSSTTSNSVTMRAAGGYRLFSNAATNAGVSLATGGTAWAVISDRNVKKDFAPIDSRAILEKLAVLPITQWHYQWEEENITLHLGPMAQDFKAAFYPGTDDTSITTLEADGVALAAIQGLNAKLTDELKQKETEINDLKQRLEALEKEMNRVVKRETQL